MRHTIEVVVASSLMITSIVYAFLHNWQAATYFVALAALVDVDDWMRRV